jgi:hypothetical protein
MSKKREMRSINSTLSIILDGCKRTASSYLRWARGVTFPTPDDRPNGQFEVVNSTNVKQPRQVDLCGDSMEFDEVIQTLSIGDRIRVLCDDGVLVAEKISETQFELVHSQAMSQFIH